MKLPSFSTVRQKMLIGTAALAFIPILLATFFLGRAATNAGRATIESQARDQLTATREVKQEQVLDYFKTARTQIEVLASAPDVLRAMRGFTEVFPKFKEQAKFDRAAIDCSLRR